jgi:hypothetical protein
VSAPQTSKASALSYRYHRRRSVLTRRSGSSVATYQTPCGNPDKSIRKQASSLQTLVIKRLVLYAICQRSQADVANAPDDLVARIPSIIKAQAQSPTETDRGDYVAT